MSNFGFKLQQSNRKLLSENKKLKDKIRELETKYDEIRNDYMTLTLQDNARKHYMRELTDSSCSNSAVVSFDGEPTSSLVKNKKRINKPFKKYNLVTVEDNHFIYANGKKTSYTVTIIRKVKEHINDYESYPDLDSFNTLLPYSESVRDRILWNIENGVFDVFLFKKNIMN